MILEFWKYLTTTPKIKQAKEMGYVKEAIAMDARAKRCQKEWDEHYQNCRKVILKAAERAVQHRTVLIFGAGSLKDVPVTELATQFEQVYLVDLVFLKSAQNKVQGLENVFLIEHDVTESLDWISQGEAVVQSPSAWLDDTTIDLVVSLNLITQLPLIPVRWLITDFNLSEEDADIVGKQLIFAHMHYLRQFSGEVCLIADRLDIEFNELGQEIDRFDPWWDVEPPKADFNWEWQVIPLGENGSNKWQKNYVGVSFL
ncbi:hypothetical protein [Thiomicrorhabdus sp.]|uniref:hypothetical protein n=1 Tax=Thiomicrorhabdus sp. TaxID=2039724 RepID=UPI002AA8B867|nr:hypothetical protein [Thiomicrorhabdus sp.]